MSVLKEYFKNNENKEMAYEYAVNNTKYNSQSNPIISKDDEWINEIEWDELYYSLKNK